MNIGKKLYVKTRRQWRSWLTRNHRSAPEIWLVYYKKHSGKKRILYNDAVEEALCYGWIDSITKPIDENCWAQRFSPRRKNSFLSETNKERVRRLIKARKMTRFGLASIKRHLDGQSRKSSTSPQLKKFILPNDILEALRMHPVVWKQFMKFPQSYKRIRIGWIDAARKRPEIFQQRLRYFIKMTAQNKKYGMVQ